MVSLVTVSSEKRAGDECMPSTLFRDIVFNFESKFEHLLVIGNFAPSKPQWSLVTVLVVSSKVQ